MHSFSSPRHKTRELSKGPEDGVYVDGLFLDSAAWDFDKMMLADAGPKVLFSVAPRMWLRPKEMLDITEFPSYECPVYKTSERFGQLSTTGQSTNYVMAIKLSTDRNPEYWIKRGVAMITQLDD